MHSDNASLSIVWEFPIIVASMGLNFCMTLLIAVFAGHGYSSNTLSGAIARDSELGESANGWVAETILELGNPISIWFFHNKNWVSVVWLEIVFNGLPLVMIGIFGYWSWKRLLKPLLQDIGVSYEIP